MPPIGPTPPSTPPGPPSRRDGKPEPSRMPPRNLLIWFAALTLLMLAWQFYQSDADKVETIVYNPNFVQLVATNQVVEAEVFEDISGRQYIDGQRRELDPRTGKARRFRVDVKITPELISSMVNHGIKFAFKRQSPYIWQILSGMVLPILLVFGLLYFVNRQMKSAGAGALGFGKSRAKMLNRDRNKTTFKDVAGVEEAKEEVQEVVEFLKDPKKFQKLGGRMPKGVLLMGPPGTGKTLLAKAIAGEADVPFFTISGADFVEMFVGVGASRVRDMFEQAKRSAPCIIFIDEIDAVGRSRGTGIGGGHDEREQTLNALLVEMDGFDTQEGIIIIAATNRPDVLDPALLRPGRFDRQIVIDLPTLDGRVDILKIHARKIVLDPDVDLRRIGRGTPGCSGADLANLLNEAALLASRSNKESVNLSDLEEARDKVRWGRERRSRVLDEKEKRITAYHESGHAILTVLVEESEPLHKLTIIPRGTAYLGATMQLPEKDRHLENRTKMRGVLVTLMGGRMAELLTFNEITSGASSDLKQATHLAHMMVCDWGMSEAMGPQTFGQHEELMFLGREISRQQDFSDDTARRIDEEVHRLLQESYERARVLLTEHRADLDKIAALLIERETLDGRDVEDLVRFGRIRTEAERAATAAANEVVPGAAPVEIGAKSEQ